jgi:hypothetical protein
MDYKVVDNFLSDEQHAALKAHLIDDMVVPWFYNPFIAYKEDKEIETGFQFIHNFFRPEVGFTSEPGMNMLLPLLQKINPVAVHRIKANLGPRTSKNEVGGWHTDFHPDDLKCRTAVYYLNTNNGYTLFKDGTKVESVANRLVEFDSTLEHTSVSCTDEKVRCLINLNYSF